MLWFLTTHHPPPTTRNIQRIMHATIQSNFICLYIFYFSHHFFFTQADENDKDGGVSVEKLLETEKSWDGVSYQAYPKELCSFLVYEVSERVAYAAD
ncbi:hypothetical protein [Sodalis glossinidius]|uniref:hypothetical protein n=1 Tax=Sodalis glossinidius TaxID=63612 RepID=UPI0011D0D24E|nr:hypothetical protein [Sodalis glossinidius]